MVSHRDTSFLRLQKARVRSRLPQQRSKLNPALLYHIVIALTRGWFEKGIYMMLEIENLTNTNTTTGGSWTWNSTAPYLTYSGTTTINTPYVTYSTSDMHEERIARLEEAIAKLEARLSEIEKLLKGDF